LLSADFRDHVKTSKVCHFRFDFSAIFCCAVSNIRRQQQQIKNGPIETIGHNPNESEKQIARRQSHNSLFTTTTLMWYVCAYVVG
jgi:hypothetical protein